jgi:ribose 5-phosphate isomerase B
MAQSRRVNPEVEQIVKRVVSRLVAERSGGAACECSAKPESPAAATASAHTGVLSASADPGSAVPQGGHAKALIDAAAIEALPRNARFEIGAGAVVTPLAADVARERNITMVRTPGCPGGLTIAVGADHGGYRLKEHLRAWLASHGHRVIDHGTSSETACDYPDFALAVARSVASGAAQFGIVVDGAGIGSAMVANRVAGVLAASCPDVDAARNAREHNYATVLTLGAKRLGEGQAQEIVNTFLTTPEGEARHRRRVDKIRALDRLR